MGRLELVPKSGLDGGFVVTRNENLRLIWIALVVSGVACDGVGPGEDLVLPSSSSALVEDVTPVATVASRPITAFALRRSLAQHGADLSEKLDGSSKREEALRELIRLEVLAQAARDAGFDQDPEIQMAITRLLADRYLNKIRELNPGAEIVTDEDVEEFYEAHEADYSRPARARASILFLKVEADASSSERDQLRREAEALRKSASSADAMNHASFAALARERSNDAASRRRGGDIGWLPAGVADHRWPGELTSSIEKLKREGDVSPVVSTARGFYVVRLTGLEAGGARPLDEVSREIRGALQAKRERELADQRMDELTKRYPVEIDEQAVSAVGVRPESSPGLEQPPSFPIETPTASKGSS